MSIWKELSKSHSFTGEYKSAVAQPTVDPSIAADETRHRDGPSGNGDKKESILGRGAIIEGIIEGDGDMRIAGEIKGDIHLAGNLQLDAGGRVVGEVSVASAIIAGQVKGNVHASGHVALLESGEIVGDVKAKFLTAALGSRLRGNVEFGWDEPEIENPIQPRTNSPEAQDHACGQHHREER